MSELTPEKVAAAVCEGVGGWMESMQAALSVTAEGNVLSLDVARWDEEGNETVRHFRAVVVEAPAYDVAAEPVAIDGDTARELAYSDPGDTVAGWTVVVNEYIEKQRWESLHWLVIRNEQGEHFANTYSKGLTEYQSVGAYEDAETARFAPVVPKYKVVTDWVAAEAAQAQKGGGNA